MTRTHSLSGTSWITTSSQHSSAPLASAWARIASRASAARMRPAPGWTRTGDLNRRPGQRRSATSASSQSMATPRPGRRRPCPPVRRRCHGRCNRSGRGAGSRRPLELAPAVLGGPRQLHVGGVGVAEAEDALGPVRRPATVPELELVDQDDVQPGGRRPPGGGEAHGPATDHDEIGGPVPHLRGERTAPVRRRYRSRGSCGSRARTSGSRAGRSSSCGPRRGRRRCAACACGRTSQPAGSTG